MENNYIQFRRERDFGEVFNATFYFIKQEYKRLGMAVVYYILPFALASAVAAVIYQSKAVGFQLNHSDPNETISAVKDLYLNLAKLMFVYSFSHAAILSTIYGYIRLYVEKGPEGFTAIDVWGEFRTLYFPFYFSLLLGGLIIGIGSVMCLFPGIYLAVSLCLLFAAMAFEKQGFGNAFSRTFQLTHLQWWWTLLVIFVLYILIMIFSIILSVPSIAFNMTTSFHRLNNEEPVSRGNLGIIMMLYSGIITIITTILYLIPQVALAFQYFSLVEKKEKPTLLDKINEIGKDTTI